MKNRQKTMKNRQKKMKIIKMAGGLTMVEGLVLAAGWSFNAS